MAVEITGINKTPLSDKQTDAASAPTGKTVKLDAQDSVRSEAAGSALKPSPDRSLDKITLTQQAEELRMIEKAVGNQADVDKQRVASLKLEIDAGRYDIDTQRVAEKLIEFESLFVA